MKQQTVYVCSKCDAQTLKWAGRCFECGTWGSLNEKTVTKPLNSELRTLNLSNASAAKPMVLGDIVMPKAPRLASGINEFDRVLGGGIVAGSVILISGEPGIGKSTLLAQVCGRIAKKSGAILYTSGEESASQVHERFSRVGAFGASVLFLPETDAATLAATIEKEKPVLAIIDSVNTLRGPSGKAGTPADIRAASSIIISSAKHSNIPVILVGQVRKDGEVAGPKALEHLVDVVLSLEGEAAHSYRILRANKNRFGSIDEVGIFSQSENGLEEVANPSSLFLNSNGAANPGSVVTALLEGSRPILCEIQALTHRTSWGTPARRASGIDPRRLDVIIAVLSRRAGLRLDTTDVHVNVAGGMRIKEPAADLAITMSIASAYRGKPLPLKTIAIGEVGLDGEIRNVKDASRRLKEAVKLGFQYAITPAEAVNETVMKIIQVKTVSDALEIIG